MFYILKILLLGMESHFKHLTVYVSDLYQKIDRASPLLKTGSREDSGQQLQTVEVSADQREWFPVASSI